MENPVWALAGVRRLCWQGSPGLEWRGRGFCPGQSASLCTAVSGSARLNWGRRCVPLTRGLRIPWGNPVWALAGVRQLRWQGSPGLESTLASFIRSDVLYLIWVCILGQLAWFYRYYMESSKAYQS